MVIPSDHGHTWLWHNMQQSRLMASKGYPMYSQANDLSSGSNGWWVLVVNWQCLYHIQSPWPHLYTLIQHLSVRSMSSRCWSMLLLRLYPIKYTGFCCFYLCFVVVVLSIISLFMWLIYHTRQGYFTGTDIIMGFKQYQSSNPEGFG